MSGPTANISTTTTSGTNNAAANSNNTNNGSNGGGSTSPIVSLSIRSEIHRFESVHPSIYNIYELLDHVADPVLAQVWQRPFIDCFCSFIHFFLSSSWWLPQILQCHVFSLFQTIREHVVNIEGNRHHSLSLLLRRELFQRAHIVKWYFVKLLKVGIT